MSKYNISLTMDANTSQAKILKKISNGSVVLEFGPAHGVMTKYLKETLACKIYAVEIDEEAALDTKSYCEDLLVDDIENYNWQTKFNGTLFDYVIFADVLEHLYNPWKVLKESKKLLNKNGRILISLPNISHNSIIMSLIDDEFNYRPTGLLDDTHIRFFTQKTLEKMIEECDCRVVSKDATILNPKDTEFKKHYADFNKGIVDQLSSRKNGHVYQYIYELVDAKSEVYAIVDEEFKQPLRLELFYDVGNGYNSNDVIIHYGDLSGAIVIDLDVDILGFRLDPFATTGMFVPEGFYVIDKDGNQFECVISSMSGFDIKLSGAFICLGEDPQVFLNLPIKNPYKLIYKFQYKEIFLSKNELNSIDLVYALKADIYRTNQELQTKDQELHDKDQELHDKDQELHDKDQELHDKDQELQQMRHKLERNAQELQQKNQELQQVRHKLKRNAQELQQKNQELQQVRHKLKRNAQELQQKDQELQDKEQELQQKIEAIKINATLIDEIMNSTSWKVTKPARVVLHYCKSFF